MWRLIGKIRKLHVIGIRIGDPVYGPIIFHVAKKLELFDSSTSERRVNS